MTGMDIAFFGSSLVSAYWNGAAGYYRGIVRALAMRGHRVTFYEPDAFERQAHRDIEDPPWAKVVVYPAAAAEARRAVEAAHHADLVIKASGIGVNDELLEEAVLDLQRPGTQIAFWDVEPPVTLERVHARADDPLRALLARYDLVFTYGGGAAMIETYLRLGARRCVPIHNALDPSTHHPVARDLRFGGALGVLANRLPEHEHRVEELFLRTAAQMPWHRFVLGGAGWADKPMPANVDYVGHVYPRDHNAFHCTPTAVLCAGQSGPVADRSSPEPRLFEAAGAAACVITHGWDGLEQFLEPGHEVLVGRDAGEVARHLEGLTPSIATAIGERARARMLREHTYAHRAVDVEDALGVRSGAPPARRAMKIVMLGLSITSSWGDGHATTYRGLVRELAARGHDVLFLERDSPWYADHRDLARPAHAHTALYASVDELQDRFTATVRDADAVIVGSGVPQGATIGRWVVDTARGATAFYDVDTAGTLARLAAGDTEFLTPELIPRYRLYLSFTGGPPLARLEQELGAPCARPLYCAVDPELHYPEAVALRWDLGYMGRGGDERQPALRRLLLEPARALADRQFVAVGPQAPALEWPPNVDRIEHLPPAEHRGFYSAMRYALDVTRRDVTVAGWSPSVRVLEAAACGVPIISDVWEGIETLFEPGREILLARSGADVLGYLRDLGEPERRAIGLRARTRVLAAHTAAHRAIDLERYLREVG